MFSLEIHQCVYTKSLKRVFLWLHFHFLPQVNCRSRELTTKTPWQSISFGERPPSTNPRSSDRHAIVRENCFVLVFVETVFCIFSCTSFVFVDFVEMSFCLDCTPLFTSTVWKSLLNLCLLFSAVINFHLIKCFFESFINFTKSFKSYKMANSRSFSSTPSYDFVCFLTSA